MSSNNFYAKLTHPFRKLFRREHTVIGKQRLALLLFCYIPIMFLGVLANFLGLTEPSAAFFGYTHSFCIFVAIVYFYLFCIHKISITICLATFILLGQVIISVEMVYCAYQDTTYYNMLIMANMVLLSLNCLVATAAYMKRITTVLGILSMAIYIVCSVITDDTLLKSFIAVFVLVFIFVCIVGMRVANNIGKLEQENEEYRKDESEILKTLRLKREEVKTIVSLASQKYQHNGAKALLERLDPKAKNNIISNVEVYLRDKNANLDMIAKVFPTFSPSEMEVCRLILQDKKMLEICSILDKTESNINSQRVNMRRKLGLKPSENLQRVLKQRMDDAVLN